jgi:hypothetical protein
MQAARPSALVTISFVSATFSACSRSDPRAAPNVSAAAPRTRPAPLALAAASATIAVPAGAERHACTKDADCLLSCFHGAVNAAWYHAAVPDGDLCEDGCASKGLDRELRRAALRRETKG